MQYKDENITRACAILTTEPEDYQIKFGLGKVIVAGQELELDEPDDCEVLAILMANKEFGFAVGYAEQTTNELRTFQQVWLDASREMQCEDLERR